MTIARFRKLSAVVLAVTLGVILWGAFVRATGSGAGCGSHWPTCNGEVIPRPKTLATIIELTHRLTSGLSFLLVLGQLVAAVRLFPRRHPARDGAIAAMAFMVSEALVGAGLVLFEHVAKDASIARAAWISVHLVNTYFLVAALTLTTFFAREGARRPRLRGQGLAGGLAAIGLVGALVVGVSGAIAALGDTLFPVTSFAEGVAHDFSPTAHLFVRLRVLHPMLASLLAGFLLLAGGAIAARRASPSVRRASAALVVMVLAQVAAGFVNIALLAPVGMQIVHLLFADFVWIALVVLTAEALGSDPSPATAAPALADQPGGGG